MVMPCHGRKNSSTWHWCAVVRAVLALELSPRPKGDVLAAGQDTRPDMEGGRWRRGTGTGTGRAYWGRCTT